MGSINLLTKIDSKLTIVISILLITSSMIEMS